ADHVDQVSRSAAVARKAAQASLREGAEEAVFLESDHRALRGVRGEERVAAQAQGRVENFVAGPEPGGGKQRIGLSFVCTDQAQEPHAGGGAEGSAVLVEIGAAASEDQDGCARVTEDLLERAACARLGAQADA